VIFAGAFLPQDKFEELKKLRSRLPRKEEEYSKLRSYLILSNGAFGMQYAIRYCKNINDPAAIEDIFQQAQMGITEAVDRYDPDIVSKKTGEPVHFTTFAYHYVRKCIVDFIKYNKLVVAPREIAKNMKHVADTLDKMIVEKKGCIVTNEDIRERLLKDKDIDIEEHKIDEIRELLLLNSAGSEDAFICDQIGGLSNDESTHEVMSLLKSLAMKKIEEVDPRLRKVIKMRFGIDYARPHSIPEIRMLLQITEDEMEEFKEQTRVLLNKGATDED